MRLAPDGSILAINISPRMSFVSGGGASRLALGKSVESVVPVMYTLPILSVAIAYGVSAPEPPKVFAYLITGWAFCADCADNAPDAKLAAITIFQDNPPQLIILTFSVKTYAGHLKICSFRLRLPRTGLVSFPMTKLFGV